MALPHSLIMLLLSLLPTTDASPLRPELHNLQKRSPSFRNIGFGFAMAISVLIFTSIVFYLGVRYGRTGTLFCWRRLRPTSPTEKVQVIDTEILKSRISSPIRMHSSALPELSPIEAQPQFAELPPVGAQPKFLKLAATNVPIVEMGQPSPRRPPSAVSTMHESFRSSRKGSLLSVYRISMASAKTTGKSARLTQKRPPKANSWFDRRSWFCRGAMEVEDEEKRIRGLGITENLDASKIAIPASAVVVDKDNEEDRETMHWSGMEWLTKTYNVRKSGRLSGMRSFYISGDDK